MWQEENKSPGKARKKEKEKRRTQKEAEETKKIVLTKETDPWGTVSSHP
jgi:hypothetical protein